MRAGVLGPSASRGPESSHSPHCPGRGTVLHSPGIVRLLPALAWKGRSISVALEEDNEQEEAQERLG